MAFKHSLAGIALLLVLGMGTGSAFALNQQADPPLVQGEVRALAADPSGSAFYVAGVFTGTRDFDLGPGIQEFTSNAGSFDVFVTRLSPTGQHVWTQIFGGSGLDIVYDISISPTTVYVCGATQSTNAQLGAGLPLTNLGQGLAYVFALDSNDGSPRLPFGGDGIVTLDGVFDEGFNRVLVDGSRVYVGGSFMSPSATVDGGTVLSNTDPMGLSSDGVLLALSTTTGFLDTSFSSNGVVQMVGNLDEIVHGIAVSGTVLYIAGFFTADLGIETAGGAITAGASDAFVAAVSSINGAPVLSFDGDGIQTFGGTGLDMAFDIRAGSTVFVTGSFSSTNAGFGGVTGSIATAGGDDAFVLALNTSGGAVLAFGGGDAVVAIGGSSNDRGLRINIDNGIVVVGDYGSTSGGIEGVGSVTSAGMTDAFAAALSTFDGSPILQVSGDGIQTFGGASADFGYGLGTNNSDNVFVAGSSFSTDARVGGTFGPFPNYDVSGFGGFFAGFARLSGLQEDLYDENDSAFFILKDIPANGATANLFGNDEDFYQVTLPVGPFNSLLLYNDTVPATFELLSSSGAVLASGVQGAATSEIDFNVVTADVYKLRVVLSGASPNLRQYIIDNTSGSGGGGVTLTASQNPARVGVPVTFTTTGASATASFDYQFGTGDNDSVNPAVYTFLTPGTFTVSVDVDDAGVVSSDSLTITVLGPNSGGTGTTIAANDPPITNPLDGLTVSVAGSDGGVVELSINVDSLVRETFLVDTDFTDLPGRGTPAVRGNRPVKKFTGSGIFISTTKATDMADGMVKGRARKTLPISRAETGETALISAAPVSAAISKFSLKGKFVFDKPDSMDEVTFSGSVEMPAGLDLTLSHPFSVSVGNVVEDVALDPKGKPTSTGAAGRIKKLKVTYPKAKKGTTTTTTGQFAKFSFTLRLKDAEIAGFDTEGITNKVATSEASLKSVPRKIQTALVLAGVSYDGLIDVQYKLAKDKGDGVLSGRGGK